jgi:SAM-dependent methyltransferase
MNNFLQLSQQPFSDPDQSIIVQSIGDGLKLFDHYCLTKNTHSPSLNAYLSKFLIFTDHVIRGIFLQNPVQFKIEQYELFAQIHSQGNRFADETKLFLEFMLGLCRFYLCLELFLCFSKFCDVQRGHRQSKRTTHIQLPPCHCESCQKNIIFWVKLHNLSRQSNQATTELISVIESLGSLDFWIFAKDFFNNHTNFKALAQYLMSMHYIPQDKKMLRRAQILHWGGFGGDGHLIAHYQQLVPLSDHIIGYHNKDSGRFNPYVEVIFKEVERAKQYALETSTKILQAHYAAGDHIKILDVGSGPQSVAAKSIIDALFEADENRHITLTAAEVDGDSIIKLQHLAMVYSHLKEIRYLDLNCVDDIPEREIIEGEFDVVIASLVLHQLASKTILNVLKFFARILKPGGYCFCTEVGKDAYYQTLLVPANVVDREGSMLAPHELTFRLISTSLTEHKCKIAYPLLETYRSFPNPKQQLYFFSAFQVVVLPEDKIDQLDKLWQAGGYAKADDFINRHKFPHAGFL